MNDSNFFIWLKQTVLPLTHLNNFGEHYTQALEMGASAQKNLISALFFHLVYVQPFSVHRASTYVSLPFSSLDHPHCRQYESTTIVSEKYIYLSLRKKGAKCYIFLRFLRLLVVYVGIFSNFRPSCLAHVYRSSGNPNIYL